jgi:hypothetical protein
VTGASARDHHAPYRAATSGHVMRRAGLWGCLRCGQATPDLLIAVVAVVVWNAWAQLTLALA